MVGAYASPSEREQKGGKKKKKKGGVGRVGGGGRGGKGREKMNEKKTLTNSCRLPVNPYCTIKCRQLLLFLVSRFGLAVRR